jgi:4-diphosphocytidyl-2-C-methyl-D-erythritol kinase
VNKRTPVRRVSVRAHAKINLSLIVGARRADGHHDVRTVLQSIALFDDLRAASRAGPFALSVRAAGVPSDRTNLVWRAAVALWRAAGRDGDPRDATVSLRKRIPPAAGLGGGSADAAAALVALNEVWRCGLSRADLLRVAATIGADVPFTLVGGTALGLGRGDEIYPLADVTPLGVVLLTPAFGVATADAYRWLDEDRAHGLDATPAAAPALDVGWPTGPVPIGNDLQPPAARRHPALGDAIAACRDAGALAAGMTGSGSTVFALFPRASVSRAARRLKRPGWRRLVTRTLSRREAGRRPGSL